MHNYDIIPVSVWLLLYQLRVYTNAWIPSLDVLSSIKEKSVKITDGTKEEGFENSSISLKNN